MHAPRAAVVLGVCGSGTPTSLSEPDTRGTGCGSVRTSGSVGGGARQRPLLPGQALRERPFERSHPCRARGPGPGRSIPGCGWRIPPLDAAAAPRRIRGAPRAPALSAKERPSPAARCNPAARPAASCAEIRIRHRIASHGKLTSVGSCTSVSTTKESARARRLPIDHIYRYHMGLF